MQVQMTPLWVKTLRKSNVYYNPDDKKGRLKLPHNRFKKEQQEAYWADILSSDGNTQEFINRIKSGKLSEISGKIEGLDGTIGRLNWWKADVNKRYYRIEAISDLIDVKGDRPSNIIRRINSLIDEVLPELEKRKKKGRDKAVGESLQAKGLDRISVESDPRKDKIMETLDEYFDTWDEGQQKAYLKNLNEELSVRKLTQWKDEFTQKYRKKILPLIRRWKWDRIKTIQVTTDRDLSSLDFKRTSEKTITVQQEDGSKEELLVGIWHLYDFTGEIDDIKQDIFNITETKKNIKVDYMPIYRLFGRIEAEKEKTEYDFIYRPEGFIDTENWKVKEPFTSDDAQYYLEKIVKSNQFNNVNTASHKDIFIPEKLKEIKGTSAYIHMSLKHLLDRRYEDGIEDGSMAETFLINMESMKFANEKYRFNYTVQTIWRVSNPSLETTAELTNHPYYMNLPNKGKGKDFKDYKKEIERALKEGRLKETYDEEKLRLTRHMKYYNQSLNKSEFDFLNWILDDDEREHMIDESFPENEEEQTSNQKEILKIIGELLKNEERLRETEEKPITYGEIELTAYLVKIKSDFNKIKRLITLSGEEENNEFKNAHDLINDKNDEALKEFDKVLVEKGRMFDVPFNETHFPTNHHKNIAEIAYRSLSAGYDLDHVLSGKPVKDQLNDLDNLYNVIIMAERVYETTTEKKSLFNLTKEVKTLPEGETINYGLDGTKPTYADEINQIADKIKESIPKLREAITDDIKKTLNLILSVSFSVQQKRKASQKQNAIQILQKKGIFVEGK